ncbi:MAG: hypothetical protein H0V29_03270 [Thermoleophilaceae bacterium]|nr:hypothetical protein [Thermoleophilaceae bacterium]
MRRIITAILAVLALSLVMAACGDDEDSGGESSTTSGDSGGDSKLIEKDPANASKKQITIGSKNFAEQYILGEIYAQSLEAAGYKVDKQLDLGSEQIAFKALKKGTIDAYPEYSGTALTSFYKVKTDDVPRDKEESFSQLEEKLKGDDIVAFTQTPFENTFRIASSKEFAEKVGNPKTVSELAENAGTKYKISGFPECRQRTDCLLGLNQVYDWKPKFVSSQGKFEDLDKNQSDLTFGFSTDGEFALNKYASYEDDKQLFPPYFVTLLVRKPTADELGPKGREIVESVQEPLNEEVMQELNSRVTIDKEKPEAVAASYLKEEGFTK